MRRFAAFGVCVLAVSSLLAGCAVGSATAGYAASAGSADDLKSDSRARIVEEAVSKSNAYTDAKIAEMRSGR